MVTTVEFRGRDAYPYNVQVGLTGEYNASRVYFDPPVLGVINLYITYEDGAVDVFDVTNDGLWVIGTDVTRHAGKATAYLQVTGPELELLWRSKEFNVIIDAVGDIDDEIEKQYPSAMTEALVALHKAIDAVDGFDQRVEDAENSIDQHASDGVQAIEEKTDEQLARIPEVETLAKSTVTATPEAYGAAGDGSDASNAIRDALASGKHVVLNGEYSMIRPIRLTDGMHLTINGRLEYHPAVTTSAYNAAVIIAGNDVVLDGTGRIHSYAEYGIRNDGAMSRADVSINTLVVSNADAYGIYLSDLTAEGSTDAHGVSHNNFHDMLIICDRDADGGNKHGQGIRIYTRADGYVNENKFDAIDYRNWEHAVYILNGSAHSINRNQFLRSETENSVKALCCRSIKYGDVLSVNADNVFEFRANEWDSGEIEVDGNFTGNTLIVSRLRPMFITCPSVADADPDFYRDNAVHCTNMLVGMLCSNSGSVVAANPTWGMNGRMPVFDIRNGRGESSLISGNLTFDYDGSHLTQYPGIGRYVFGTANADAVIEQNYLADWSASPINDIEVRNPNGMRLTIKNGRVTNMERTFLKQGVYHAVYAYNHITIELKEIGGGTDDGLTKRVEKLEAAAEGNLYMFREDDADAYEKAVPADALKWATMDKVGGKTLVWNQLAPYSMYPSTSSGVSASKLNTNGQWKLTGTATDVVAWFTFYDKSLEVNHVYYYGKLPKGVGYGNPWNGSLWNGDIVRKNIVSSRNALALSVNSGVSLGDNGVIATPQVFDLTAMFGAERADTMTAEEFRAMFPADYYPYSEPTLMSFEPRAAASLGRNIISRLMSTTVFTGTLANVKFEVEPSGIITLNGTATSANSTIIPSVIIPEDIKGKKIVLGVKRTHTTPTNSVFVGAFDVTGTAVNNINGGDFLRTSTPNCVNVSKGFTSQHSKTRIWFGVDEGETYNNDKIEICAYLSDKDEGFIPHFEYTTSLTSLVQKYFPDDMKSAGDVHDEIDLERGVAVQRVGSVDLGTLKWNKSLNYFVSYTDMFYVVSSGIDANVICGEYTVDTFNRIYAGIGDKTVAIASNGNIGIRDLSFDDATAFKAAMSGVMLYYELAEPIETPIDPTDLAGLTDLNVEAGGTLSFTNQHGDDYRVPLPSRVEFKVKQDLAGDVRLLKGDKADLSLLGGLKFQRITQEEYNLISAPDASTVYLIVG